MLKGAAMRLLSSLFGCSLVLATFPSMAAEPPIGEWLVENKYAQVLIENCGGALWGVISWEARPGGRDNENPDPALRGRPVLGMPILLDMKEKMYDREVRWSGRVYNSENGKTYSANIRLINPNVMKLEGCLFTDFLCGGQDWTRVVAGSVTGSPTGPQSKGPAPKGQPKGVPAAIDVCSKISR
jgi:uncharacterized protein (DUF2147 family)